MVASAKSPAPWGKRTYESELSSVAAGVSIKDAATSAATMRRHETVANPTQRSPDNRRTRVSAAELPSHHALSSRQQPDQDVSLDQRRERRNFMHSLKDRGRPLRSADADGPD